MNQKLRFLMLALLCAVFNFAWGANFVKVTDASQVQDGKNYILVCDEYSVAMSVYASGTYCAHESVVINNNAVTTTSETINVFKLEVTGDNSGYYLKQNSDSKYIYCPQAKSLKADAEKKSVCVATITNDFQVNFGDGYGTIQYNASSPRFCTYTSAQKSAYLYVEDDGATPSVSDKYYVAGSWTNPTWGDGKIQMTKNSDGTYTLANQELTAGAQFKIIKVADGSSDLVWYGAVADGDTYWVTLDNHTDILMNGSKNFYLDVEGTWTFIVDPTGDTPTLTVDGWPEWEYYLLGDFNEWEISNSYKFSDAGSLNKPIKKGEKFKIYAKRGSEDKWYGAVSNGDFYVNADHVDTELSLTTENGGENFYMNLSNKKPYWTLDFDPANMKLILSNYLSDIAELPFEFDGGRSDIEGKPGLTTNGLGTDYGSSPKLKFSTANNMVVLHFDEQPGKLTYDIKGNPANGKSSIEGEFVVQTSVDGTDYTDLKSYTTLDNTGQSETFDNLGENVRYIKWLYKSRTSGNVALGNIKLEKYVAPQPYTLTITENENAEIFVFYQNDQSEPIQSGTEVYSSSPMLISVSAKEDYQIENVTVTDEEGQAVTLNKQEDGSWTFIMPSSNVTVACTVTYVDPTLNNTYAKVTSTDDITDGNYLIVYETGAVAFDGSLETLDAVGNTIPVTIKNNEIKASKSAAFTIDVTNGTIKSYSGHFIGMKKYENNLRQDEDAEKQTNTFSIDNDGNAIISIDFGTSGAVTLRYNKASGQTRFRYFKSGQQAIQLYKEVVEPFELTISEKATDGKTYFATMAKIGYGNFEVPDGVTVSTVQVTSAGKIERKIIESGSVIPGTEAYLVESNAPGQYNFNPTEGEAVTLGANMLYPTVKGEYTTVPASVGDNSEFTFYKLSLNGNNDPKSVGFYYGVAGGEPFLSKNDNTAFLAVPKSTYNPNPANQGILINPEETDGIQSVATELGNREAYTLTGVRVQGHLQKGVYIINGRKQVIK